MAEALRIHQALYGYQDGHRLLASSTELPQGTSRLLLPLSDGPDLQIKVPMAGYMSGYPVSEIEAFALSMTWPAPEMPRPGCVWTHVLLIDSGVLGAIHDPCGLLECFHRPEGPEPDRTSYSAPLSYEAGKRAPSAKGGDLSLSLLYWLYMSMEPLVLRAEERSLGELEVLSLWGQQWPELREGFSFVSIASTREVSSRPFDVRLVFDSDPVLERALDAPIRSSSEVSGSSESWLAVAVEDLATPGQFREMLWRYGPEAGRKRSAFAPIARVYAAQRSVQGGHVKEAQSLLELVTDSFPDPGWMRGLKRDLFGPPAEPIASESERGEVRWHGSDLSMLHALVISQGQHALDAGDLEIDARAKVLWAQSVPQALEILQLCAERPERPFARMVIDALLPLATGDPDTLIQKAPAAVALAIDHDPTFAANSSVWRGSEPEIERRWGVLSTIPGSLGAVRKEILKALISSGAPSAIHRALGRWGTGVVSDLLEIAGEPSAPDLDERWVVVIRNNPDAALEWLASTRTALRRRQMELVAESVDPEKVARLGLPLSPWRELLKGTSAGDIRQVAFLFQLALASSDPNAALLLRETFVPLRKAIGSDAAAASIVPGKNLKTKLKSNGRPIRISPLTSALVERWRRDDRPIGDLLEGELEPEVVAEIAAAYARTKKGSKEVERFIDSLSNKRDAELIHAVPSDLRPSARKE